MTKHKHKPNPRAATVTDKEIGERIRALRVVAQVTQAELADHIGVSFQQVQKYEKGVNAVRGARLAKIAGMLGTTTGHLLGLDEEGKPTSHNVEMMRFLGTHGGAEMAKAFMSLPEYRRRMVIDIASALAHT